MKRNITILKKHNEKTFQIYIEPNTFNGEEIVTDIYNIKKRYNIDSDIDSDKIKKSIFNIPFDKIDKFYIDKLFNVLNKNEVKSEKTIIEKSIKKGIKQIFFHTFEKLSGTTIVTYNPRKIKRIELPPIDSNTNILDIINTFLYINIDFNDEKYLHRIFTFLDNRYNKNPYIKLKTPFDFKIISSFIGLEIDTNHIYHNDVVYSFNILEAIRSNPIYREAIKYNDYKAEKEIRNALIKQKKYEIKTKDILDIEYKLKLMDIKDVANILNINHKKLYRINHKHNLKLNKYEKIEKDIIEYIEKFESENEIKPSMYRIVKDTKYARTTVKKYYDKYYKK